MNQPETNPKLSVVAVTRNDNHGGDMNARMNLFVNALAQQCESYGLEAELLLVEWNPPEDRPPLAEVLEMPAPGGMLEVRIITVPREVHVRYRHAAGLPLYQMIGKNVGIRRAKGEFILATNVDILFSGELVRWMAEGWMERGYSYRLDRFDVNMPVPSALNLDTSALLKRCRERLIRRSRRDGTINMINGSVRHIFRPGAPVNRERLHTNACGDFALAHRDHWFATRAYPELDLYSFHIDSLWCFTAHFSGVREKVLRPPLAIYHFEHTGGYTPESLGTLDRGLVRRKVPRLENSHFNSMAFRMSAQRRTLHFNDNQWGLAERKLPSEVIVKADRLAAKWRINKSMSATERPRVSLIVVGRNDDHGGLFHERTQSFLDCWRTLSDAEGLRSEIVFVDWNPPADRPPLSEVFEWKQTAGVDLRFITVPERLHSRLPNSGLIPLFQMIGKNVGARRARGEWILMTNIDILFNRAMVRFLRDAPLERNVFYRAARLDCGERTIPGNLSAEDREQFCENNLIRVNVENQTLELEKGFRVEPAKPEQGKDWAGEVIRRGSGLPLYSSACGDFTLMHRDAVADLRGYPEIPCWSIYIDGLFLHAALGRGMKQVVIGDPCRIYHIEHGRSWVNDTEYYHKDKRLSHRLHYRPWCNTLLSGDAPRINPPDWGLANLALPESGPATICQRPHIKEEAMTVELS